MRTGTEKNYTTLALFIADRATWEIPKTTIPIDPKAVSDWENKGQGISTLRTNACSLLELAQRAAQLMAAHIAQRRWFVSLGITYVVGRDLICLNASGIGSTVTKCICMTETRPSSTNSTP